MDVMRRIRAVRKPSQKRKTKSKHIDRDANTITPKGHGLVPVAVLQMAELVPTDEPASSHRCPLETSNSTATKQRLVSSAKRRVRENTTFPWPIP
jgi:adenine-specific DNA glycosylase